MTIITTSVSWDIRPYRCFFTGRSLSNLTFQYENCLMNWMVWGIPTLGSSIWYIYIYIHVCSLTHTPKYPCVPFQCPVNDKPSIHIITYLYALLLHCWSIKSQPIYQYRIRLMEKKHYYSILPHVNHSYTHRLLDPSRFWVPRFETALCMQHICIRIHMDM